MKCPSAKLVSYLTLPTGRYFIHCLPGSQSQTLLVPNILVQHLNLSLKYMWSPLFSYSFFEDDTCI